MNLIENRELLKAANLNRINFPAISSMLMSGLKLKRVNQLYEHNYEKKNLEFIEAILLELQINIEIDESDLQNIPEKGPFLTISNHPFGGIDGLLLLRYICQKRSDFKIMGNFLLKRVMPLDDFIFPVNPFKPGQNLSSSVSGIMQSIRHISNGHPMGIFPAGEVSSYFDGSIQDKRWSKTSLKFIKNAQVPVVPVYFHGKNSNWFYILGLINERLRTARLASELFNKKNKKIIVRIGPPINLSDQQQFKELDQFGRYLRAKTYSLGSSLDVKNFYDPPLKKNKTPEVISKGLSAALIEAEILSLPNTNFLLNQGRYTAYCAAASLIPLTMNEIGRLREITFREVGEGSNKHIDLDEYDLYYDQLFVWDEVDKELVGAYRIGRGNDIIRFFGKKGFYINSLFHIDNDFIPILNKSIELGRSFVTTKYQKNHLCLYLLWKGILSLVVKFPEYRYLIGPVSISNSYTNFSKSLIVDFIHSNYFHHTFSKYIKPRKKFKFEYKKVDHEIILNHTGNDINKFDKLIEEIEPNHSRIPVLFKKYLQQNARIMGFNVDPKFNKALDGLMILDLYDISIETIKSLSRDIRDESILKRFYAPYFAEEMDKIPQL